MKQENEQIILDKSVAAAANRRISENALQWKPLEVGLPALISVKGLVRGLPHTKTEWFGFLEKQFGVSPTNVSN